MAATAPALAGSLHRSEVRRALAAAIALDAPTAEALEPDIARWDSLPLLRRLAEAGELVAGSWADGARAAYRDLLALPLAASGVALSSPALSSPLGPGVAGSPALRALERMDDGDRPREKALRSGIAELDDAELVALLLRTGSGDEGVIELAQRILAEVGGLAGLARAEALALTLVRGVGEAKAAELAAACELGRRLAAAQLRARPKLTTAEAVAALLGPQAVSLVHEQLWCLPLDARSCLLGAPRVVAQGDVDAAHLPLKAVLRAALSAGAMSFIVAHNHPAGDPSPSLNDLAATRSLVLAGRAVDLPLQDHVILGDAGRCASLRRTNPGIWSS